jgi:hypothetical protein
MRLYIAYKYTNIKNKSELKINLEHITQILESVGNTTFLLNRDARAWGKKHVSTLKNIYTIIKNIFISDAIFAYITSDVLSKGIIFEFLFGKLVGKRIIVAVEKKIKTKNKYLLGLASEVIEFDGMKNLETKLVQIS